MRSPRRRPRSGWGCTMAARSCVRSTTIGSRPWRAHTTVGAPPDVRRARRRLSRSSATGDSTRGARSPGVRPRRRELELECSVPGIASCSGCRQARGDRRLCGDCRGARRRRAARSALRGWPRRPPAMRGELVEVRADDHRRLLQRQPGLDGGGARDARRARTRLHRARRDRRHARARTTPRCPSQIGELARQLALGVIALASTHLRWSLPRAAMPRSRPHPPRPRPARWREPSRRLDPPQGVARHAPRAGARRDQAGDVMLFHLLYGALGTSSASCACSATPRRGSSRPRSPRC